MIKDSWNKIPWWLGDVGLVALVCAVLFFRALGAAPFYDKQEAREAVVVWEIHDSGNWILPLKNGTEIPPKPPFFHWLGAAVSDLMGRTDELTTRLPSALLGIAGVLLTYLTGFLLWGRSAGLVSALVLATSVEWANNARATRVDMALTFALLCCFLFFFYLYRSGGGRLKAALFGFFLGLATLSKGPLGFVVPCFAAFIFLAIRRDLSFLKRTHPMTIIAVCAVVAGSWYLLAFRQGGQPFVSMVIKENIGTVVGKNAGHPHPFWWYIPLLFQNMAPWSLFFPSLALFFYRHRRELSEERLLYFFVWMAAVIVFFSLFSQKRPVYILSAFPAIALLFGAWWQELMNRTVPPSSVLLARIATFTSAATYLVLAAMLLTQIEGNGLLQYFSPVLDAKDRSELVTLANLLNQHKAAVLSWAGVCGLGGVALIVGGRKQAWATVMGVLAVVGICSLGFVQGFDKTMATRYTFKPFIQRVAAMTKQQPLFSYGQPVYPLLFYADRHIPLYGHEEMETARPFYVLFWEDEWNKIRDREGLAVRAVSERTDALNPRKGHWLLVQVSKGAALPAYAAAAVNAPKRNEIENRRRTDAGLLRQSTYRG